MTSKPTYEKLEQRLQDLENELDELKERNGSKPLKHDYLKAILNNTNMPIYLKDANFKYIFMNRQLGSLSRVNHNQVEGKDDFAFFSKPVAQLFRSQDEEVIERQEVVEFEETILLPDGVQSFITAKFPLFDIEGNVTAVGGVCTDITARKRAEDELKEAEEKFRSIFEHSPLGIMHIDKEGIITECNEKLAEILGSSVKRMIGFELLQSMTDEKVKDATNSVLGGKITHYEGIYQSVVSDHQAHIRGVYSPIFSNDGSIIGAIGIIEDITKRKETEDALMKAHEELEMRVSDRTAELKEKTESLMETNVALNVLLEKREEDKRELEKKVMFNVEKLIQPHLEKLKIRYNGNSQEPLLKIIQSNLDEITSSFAPNHKNYLSSLTPAQIEIANLIKYGHSTKEIASILKLSPSTIACHRQEIRKRLSLTNKKTNLQTALTTNQ